MIDNIHLDGRQWQKVPPSSAEPNRMWDMTITRRAFLGQVAAGTLLSAGVGTVVGEAAKADHKIERLGLQLYTVRNQMGKDFEGTLAKVAEAGYREVEFAGYFDRTPKDVRAILDRHKLTAPSAHADYASVETKLPQLLETSHAVVNLSLDNTVRH